MPAGTPPQNLSTVLKQTLLTCWNQSWDWQIRGEVKKKPFNPSFLTWKSFSIRYIGEILLMNPLTGIEDLTLQEEINVDFTSLTIFVSAAKMSRPSLATNKKLRKTCVAKGFERGVIKSLLLGSTLPPLTSRLTESHHTSWWVPLCLVPGNCPR